MQRRVSRIFRDNWRTGIMAMGVLLMAAGLYAFTQEPSNTSGWPSVEGTILDSGVNSSSPYGIRGPRIVDYHIWVRYEYVVAGKRYEGSNRRLILSAVAGSTSEWEMRRVSRPEYSRGSRIRAYYDPGKPSHTVLDPSRGSDWSTKLAFTLLMALAAVFGLVAVFAKGQNG